MIVNHTKMKIVVGEPGTGKTQRLINDAVNELLLMKTVRIIVPTHSAKENIISRINDMCRTETDRMRKSKLIDLFNCISVLYGYKNEDVILIDEISMVSTPTLFNLLYQTLDVEDAEIIGYGDAKQLPVINGNSIIENLLRNNVDIDVWEWVKEAYDKTTFDKLVAPNQWKLDAPVDFEVLTYNYRLRANGYTNYNQDYINNVIANTYYNESDDYVKIIKEANENNTLIITPEHKHRGNQINDIIKSVYGDKYYQYMPFIREKSGSKVYLNPLHHDYNGILNSFNFIKTLNTSDSLIELKDKYDFTAYVVVNVAQGATVDNVLYFVGNDGIPKQAKSFYTRNNLYTAITRSRNVAQTVGNPSVLKSMSDNLPMSPQTRLQHISAKQSIPILFDSLYAISDELSIDEIYQLYIKIFNNNYVMGQLGDEIKSYNVVSIPYSKQKVINSFVDYQDDKSIIKYKNIIYNKHISNSRSNNKKGRGKIQQWVESLSDDKLNEVKNDIDKLSVRKFKAKWDKDKRYVVKYIEENNI